MSIMQTKRIYLRRIEPDDWNALYRFLRCDESQEFRKDGICTKNDCMDAAEQMSQYNTCWAVCLKSNQTMIGYITLNKESENTPYNYSLYFNFEDSYYAVDVVSEAVGRIVQYAFEELGVHRISGLACSKDAITCKEYVKQSMRKEGTMLKAFASKSAKSNKLVWLDINMYAILKDEWLKSIR